MSGFTGSIQIDDLAKESVCPCNLYSDQGALVVANGDPIDQRVIQRLRSQGISVLRSDLETTPAVQPRRSTERQTPECRAYSSERVQRIQSQFEAGEKALERLFDSVNRGEPVDIRETDQHVVNYINELADDPDPVVANALKYQADASLAYRSIQFSVLSLAISFQMNLESSLTRDIGSAALMHDWALFHLPHDARYPHQIRDEGDRQRYRRHPLESQRMIEAIEDAKPVIGQYASHVHERLDGSGFPLGLTAEDLPTGSRVLSVADAFLTMVNPPAGTVRIVPCDAVVFLISAAGRGHYSPSAVTGLLRVVSMYPLGSLVELSDTRWARVIRANQDDYGYPIVETVSEPHQVIDLKDASLFVMRPVLSKELNEVRLPETYSELTSVLDSLTS